MGDAERVRTTCPGIVPTPRHDLEELAPPHLSQSSLYLRARLGADAPSRFDFTSQRRPRAVDSVVGMIVRTDGTWVTVRDADGREWRCVLRGRLRQELAGGDQPGGDRRPGRGGRRGARARRGEEDTSPPFPVDAGRRSGDGRAGDGAPRATSAWLHAGRASAPAHPEQPGPPPYRQRGLQPRA